MRFETNAESDAQHGSRCGNNVRAINSTREADSKGLGSMELVGVETEVGSRWINQENRDPWFACYTRARQEKKVDLLLRERSIESYLPLIAQERRWHDRRKVVKWPLFASYVFVRFKPGELAQVLSIPGVATVVRLNGRLAAIAHEEITNIAAFAEQYPARAELPEIVTFVPGQRVRITSGSFEGVVGVVIEMRGKRRVLVGLREIGLGFEVNVGAELLEPLKEARSA